MKSQLLLFCLITLVSSKFTYLDFLKTDGAFVKNNYGKGNNVLLRGINIGNLFVQESWLASTNARDQKTINELLTNRFGNDKKNELLERYESSYLTSDDIAKFKELKLSVLRVPFTYMNLYEKNDQDQWKLKSNGFDRLDWIIEQCSEKGIYVILDLHGAFGSQNGMDHSGELIDNVVDVAFYRDLNLRQLTIDLWKEVANRYKGNPAVAGYDILNEPGEKNGLTQNYHWEYFNQVYEGIRSVDPDHIVIFESCWTQNDLPQPSVYGWENVIYQFHHYAWDYQSDVEGQIKEVDKIVNSYSIFSIPIYLGEFTFFELEQVWSYALNLFNKKGYHYSSWTYKTNNDGSWGVYNQKGTDRIDPASTEYDEIYRVWGPDVIGTGDKSANGMLYNQLRINLPGSVVFMKFALENKNYFTLKALNNDKYITAEYYGLSQLRANSDVRETLEHFFMYDNGDGTFSIQSRANNQFLCAVFDDGSVPIIPRSNYIDAWEKFYVKYISDNVIILKTYNNEKYIKNEDSYIKAVGNNADEATKFEITYLG